VPKVVFDKYTEADDIGLFRESVTVPVITVCPLRFRHRNINMIRDKSEILMVGCFTLISDIIEKKYFRILRISGRIITHINFYARELFLPG
jgi:hypothetical protein